MNSQYIIDHPDRDFDVGELLGGTLPISTIEVIFQAGELNFHILRDKTAMQYWRALRIFVEDFLPAQSGSSAAENFLFGEFPIGSLAECLVLAHQFDNYIVENYQSKSTRKQFGSGINYWYLRLASGGVLPNGVRSLYTDDGKSRVFRQPSSASLVDFVLPPNVEQSLEERYTKLKVEGWEQEEGRILLLHLLQELQVSEIPADLIPELVSEVLDRRLQKVRDYAECQFRAARRLRAEGLAQVRMGREHLPLMNSFMNWRKGPSAGKMNPYLVNVLALGPVAGKSAFLAWFYFSNGGIYPRHQLRNTRKYNLCRKTIRQLRIELTAESAQGLIGAGQRLQISAYLMLIHDLAANATSVQELGRNADYKVLDKLTGISWLKRRANKELSILDSREVGRTSAGKVIAVIKRATAKYKEHSHPRDFNHLFLWNFCNAKVRKTYTRDGEVGLTSVPSASWFNRHASQMIESASGGQWIGTAKSIRNSILLRCALTGSLPAVQKKAQHKKKRTSQNYADKPVFQLLLDREMRKFQRWLQSLVVIHIDSAAAKLGLDEEEHQRTVDGIMQSGFGGLYCRDPLAGIQPGTKKGEVCGAISQCMTCKNRRNLVVATEDNALHLLLWNNALKLAQEKGWVADPPELHWKMWAIFIEEALRKLEGSPVFRSVVAGARQRVSSTTNPYLAVFEPIFV